MQHGNNKRCVAPLETLSGNEIVEASLLRPTGEECRTSPIPEEEATLLGKIKCEIKPSQVPELEMHEQVHPAEQIVSPAASLHPSFPTRPPPFPEGKGVPAGDQSGHNQCWPVGPCLHRGD